MGDAIEDVREMKELAMVARDAGQYDQAVRILRRAERRLRDELSQLESRPPESGPGVYEIAVKKQLYTVLGSIGGIHRRKREFAESAKAYQEGYEIEKAFDDSYNLTQRLVSRVFADPQEVGALRQDLAAAKQVIEQQAATTRANDEYAAADLLTVSLLLGDDGWRESLQSFVSRVSRTSYARDVTRLLFVQLADEIAARGGGASALYERLRHALDQL